MRPFAALACAVALLGAPAGALAQGNPFGPLPPTSPPTPAPTPQPTPPPTPDDGDIGTTGILALAAISAALFVGVAVVITRDGRAARRRRRRRLKKPARAAGVPDSGASRDGPKAPPPPPRKRRSKR